MSKGLRVLVTGGAGYIGSHACKALASSGHTPITFDNLVYGHRWAVRWGAFEHGDILDRARLDQVMRKHRPDAVMHFAAFAYVGESVQDPAKYYRNNVVGSLTLLEAAKDHGCGGIVFSSTCATYGVPLKTPIDESHAQMPINPYGTSKLMIEQILRDYESAYGFPFVSLRYFNAAGADPDGEVGEAHDPETHLIPLTIAAALGRHSSISIFGTDYPTPDGTAIRDYIHVSDLAEAHVRALETMIEGRKSMAVNLGTGRGHSVREVVDVVAMASGRKVPVQEVGRRAGDPPILVADARRAQEVLRWTPRYPDLPAIIESALAWHASQQS